MLKESILLTVLVGMVLLTATPGFCGRVAFTTIFPNEIPIQNCEDLQKMQNNLTADYYLTKDIECEMTSPFLSDGSGDPNPNFDPFGTWGDRKGFKPVGEFEIGDYFCGSFNGKGYKIQNLYIDRPNEKIVGLFGRVSSGTNNIIRNVGLINVTIAGGGDFLNSGAGALVAIVYPFYGAIANCYSTGRVL